MLSTAAAATATYLASSPARLALQPGPLDVESAIARVEAVRYEDLQPFLDAITTVKSGRPMLCPANNLDLLPRRDAPLEVIAQLAPVRERIEPYVERAKLQIIESIRSRQADRRR